MKIKLKLNALAIGVIAVIITGLSIAGFSILLLQRAFQMSIELSTRGIRYLADSQIAGLEGKKEGYLQVLRTLAHIMEDYQDIPVEDRRDRFDTLLYKTVIYEYTMITLYTIWKPNAIDGLDAYFTARPGSCPVTGQYASAFTKESGEILQRLSTDIEAGMLHLGGPGARLERVEHLVPLAVDGIDTYMIKMMVPIIDPHTDEVVGGVGGIMSINPMQALVERTISYYDEIAVMAIYAGDGRILASYQPDRIGRKLVDVDTIYGEYIQEAHMAVLEGREAQFASYYCDMGSNVIMVMLPITIGYSEVTWALMLGSMETYPLAGVNDIGKFIIILALLSMFVSAVIIFSVLMFITKPMIIVTEKLRKISEAKGDIWAEKSP